MIETNHLRCFVAVAEELHFGRAAKRLNMTQPPLSRQIQVLERVMSCQLFDRTSRSVALTQVGKSFLPDAQRVLRLLDNARRAAVDVSEGRRGVIRCGFTAASAYEFLPNLVRDVKKELPDTSLVLKEMVSKRQIEALDSGELDVGLLRSPIDETIYHSKLVAQESLVLALPTGHPLLQKPTLNWRDLDNIEIIMYDSEEAKYFYDLLASCFVNFGVYPRHLQSLSQIHSTLSLVRASVGVAVVPNSARVLNMADVQFREFTEQTAPKVELLIVWRKNNRNPLVPVIVDIAMGEYLNEATGHAAKSLPHNSNP